jgi:NIMA (never in mitosis gene a)-related kinase
VYKVKRLEDEEVYALKKVKMLNLSEREKENALNEVRILASLNHPNVIAYKEAFIDESSSSLWYIKDLVYLI